MMRRSMVLVALFAWAGSAWAYNSMDPAQGDIGDNASALGGGSITGDLTFDDDVALYWGSSDDAVCIYDTAQTPDSLVCGVSTDSERLILTTKALVGTDLGFADAGTPMMCITDATGADVLELSHDGTDAVIETDAGNINLTPAGGGVVLSAGARLQGSTLGQIQLDGTARGTAILDGTIYLSDAADTAGIHIRAQDDLNVVFYNQDISDFASARFFNLTMDGALLSLQNSTQLKWGTLGRLAVIADGGFRFLTNAQTEGFCLDASSNDNLNVLAEDCVANATLGTGNITLNDTEATIIGSTGTHMQLDGTYDTNAMSDGEICFGPVGKASGICLREVSGALWIQDPTNDGRADIRVEDITVDASVGLSAGSFIRWTSRGEFNSPADGQFGFHHDAAANGSICLDSSGDVWGIMNEGCVGDGDMTAGAAQFSGDHSYYGEMNITSSQVIAIGADTNYYKVTGAASGNLNGMTHATSTITVTNAGTYLITGGVSAGLDSPGADPDTVLFGIFLDSGVVTGCEGRRVMDGGGDVGRLALNCLVTITAAQTIELHVKNEDGDGTDVDVELATITVTQL